MISRLIAAVNGANDGNCKTIYQQPVGMSANATARN